MGREKGSFRSAWERVQAAELLRAALHRLRPETKDQDAADNHVLYHTRLTSEPNEQLQAAKTRQERFGQIQRDLERLTQFAGSQYAKLRDTTAAILEVPPEAIDREVAKLAKDLPGGAPLALRAMLPEVLSAREIAELWSSDEVAQDALIDSIVAASRQGALQSCGQSYERKTDPVLEFRELRRLIGELRQEVNTLTRQVDGLIYENACLRSRAKWLEDGLPPEIRPRGLAPRPERGPLVGGRSVAYATDKQWLLPMVHRDDFRHWIVGHKDRQPPRQSRISSVWLASPEKRLKTCLEVIDALSRALATTAPHPAPEQTANRCRQDHPFGSDIETCMKRVGELARALAETDPATLKKAGQPFIGYAKPSGDRGLAGLLLKHSELSGSTLQMYLSDGLKAQI